MLRTGVPFTRAPQTRYEYSNFGYALLGRIVTNVSGRPFQDYIRDRDHAPARHDLDRLRHLRLAAGRAARSASAGRMTLLCASRTWRDGAFGAMGGVQTSARDYARWVAFLLSAWPARDGPEQGPVRRSTVRELAQGLNFVAVARRPGPARFLPAGAGLRHGPSASRRIATSA